MSPQVIRGLPILLLTALSAVGCPTATEEPAAPDAEIACVAGSFPLKKLELPEASGAAWVSSAHGEGWLIVSDHGNEGRAVFITPEGDTPRELELPLDPGAGDDLEGLAWSSAGRLVGLTSSGYVRQWSLEASGPQLVQLSQAISDDDDWICGALENNCGPNWEGLCLDPAPSAGGCAGFAVSKELGELLCLRAVSGSYELDPSVRIEVTKSGRLSGCDYELAPPYRLLVAGNDEAQNRFWEITSPREPETAEAEKLEIEGTLNQEAIAFSPDGQLLSFGDEEAVTGEGSAIASFFCL